MAPKWMPLMNQCETLVLAQQNAAKFWILSVDIACWQRNYTCNKWTPVLLNKGSHMGFNSFLGRILNCRTNILTFSLSSGSISRLCKKLSKCSLSFEMWKLVWTTLQDPYSTYLSSQNYSFVRLSVGRWACASDACNFEPQKNLVLSRFISEKLFSRDSCRPSAPISP